MRAHPGLEPRKIGIEIKLPIVFFNFKKCYGKVEIRIYNSGHILNVE